MYFEYVDGSGFLLVKPNPVRFDRAKPGSTVRVDAFHAGYLPVQLTHVEALGPHVEVEAIEPSQLPAAIGSASTPSVTVVLVYEPKQGEPLGDDTLVLGFNNHGDHTYQLHVPLLVK